MNLVQQLLEETFNPPEAKKVASELNKGYFITSTLEDDYLYHTTYWKRLKSILKDGFLSGNPKYLENKGVRQKHPNMISFTTSKWRHLSDLPDAVAFLGLTHDCYLKIPFHLLKGKVKPVIYKIEAHEIENMLQNGEAYYLSTLTQKEEKLKAEYGEDYPLYLYNTWIVEQEWRMKADFYPLPQETEVYVSSYYQKKIAETLTNLPVYIDKEIMKIKNIQNRTRNIRNRIIRIIGKDLYEHVGQIDVSTTPIKRPDGTTAKIHATLYNVKYLHAIAIIKRLQKAGFRVWTYGNAWKHHIYSDIEVDLTFLTKQNQ
jgi:ribulose bisphosphate carboxylase small subunit